MVLGLHDSENTVPSLFYGRLGLKLCHIVVDRPSAKLFVCREEPCFNNGNILQSSGLASLCCCLSLMMMDGDDDDDDDNLDDNDLPLHSSKNIQRSMSIT